MRALVTWLWVNVWPNLVASLICFSIASVWARREMLKLHRRHEAHAAQLVALHAKLDTLMARDKLDGTGHG